MSSLTFVIAGFLSEFAIAAITAPLAFMAITAITLIIRTSASFHRLQSLDGKQIKSLKTDEIESFGEYIATALLVHKLAIVKNISIEFTRPDIKNLCCSISSEEQKANIHARIFVKKILDNAEKTMLEGLSGNKQIGDKLISTLQLLPNHGSHITPTQHTLQGEGPCSEMDIGSISKFWSKYTIDAIFNLLILRIENLQLENITLMHCWFIDAENHNINAIIEKINNDNSGKIILIPLNLFNKHAAGLIAEKQLEGKIKITYIDPENNPIPPEIKDLLLKAVDAKIVEILCEPQRYGNCGPEVIENFIYYLTGKRATQEEAIELHSNLREQELLKASGYELHIMGKVEEHHLECS